MLHAGLYYPPGSLKARLCVQGLRECCRLAGEQGIPFRRCGKLLVAASDGDLPVLEVLRKRGEANGAEGLRNKRDTDNAPDH